MQVRLDDAQKTYYGDINQKVHPGQRYLDIPIVEIITAPWERDGTLMTRPTIHTIRLEVTMLRRSIAIAEHQLRSREMVDKIIGMEMQASNVPSDAKMSMDKNLGMMETRYHFEWPVLVCLKGLEEQVFDLDCFTPA